MDNALTRFWQSLGEGTNINDPDQIVREAVKQDPKYRELINSETRLARICNMLEEKIKGIRANIEGKIEVRTYQKL